MVPNIKDNTGIIPVDGENKFTYSYCGENFNFDILPTVAKPIIHSQLLLETIVVEKGDNVLDLGCGTGFIGIITAKCKDPARVICSDINSDAVNICEKNILSNRVKDITQCVLSDYFDNMPPDILFDVIASNPPQAPIPPSRVESEKSLSIAHFKSNFSGSDGLDGLRKILDGLNKFLKPGGQAYFVLHEYLGRKKILDLINVKGYDANVMSTEYATMSPTTKSLQSYIEKELNYKFPIDNKGIPYTLISVFTAKYS